MRKRPLRKQLLALAHIAGDIGELTAERGDPELRKALALVKTLMDRVAGEMLEGVELPLKFEE